MAFYPKGTRLVTAQLCALVDLESYEFDTKFKKEPKSTYLEYQLNSRGMCVVMIKTLSEKEQQISESVMNGIKSQAAAFVCYHSQMQ